MTDILEIEVETKTCDHCGESFGMSEDFTATSGGLVCEGCLDEYSFCELSDEYFLNENMVTAYRLDSRDRRESFLAHEDHGDLIRTENGEWWLENDTLEAHNSRNRTITISKLEYLYGEYFTCEDCSEVYDNDTGTYIESGGYRVCESCCSDNYTYCETCENTNPNHESCDCVDENSCNLIHNYSHKPTPKFIGIPKKNQIFSGFELEFEAASGSRRDQATFIMENSNNLYLKEDGSLSNGVEIVSHPHTLEEHKKNNIENMLNGLIERKAKSHDTTTCGLHVHLDKRDMTDAHKIRLGGFFALCKPELETLARRKENSYAKFKNIETKASDLVKNSERYEALNWQNSNTVEIRIFKGTLKFSTFMACLEFSHAVYEFTRIKHSFNCRYDGAELWPRFINFVEKNKSEYPNFLNYFNDKKIQFQAARDKFETEEITSKINMEH